MKAKQHKDLPENVVNLLSKARVGLFSSVSPQGRVSTVPIGFHFDGEDVYFGTPKESAKLKFMMKNPNVSLTVENGKVMKESLGVLIQGKANVFDPKKTLTKFRESLPAIAGFSKKYPDVFFYYTRDMKELPEDRKFYKYRLVHLNTEKMLFWDGYTWGRHVPEDKEKSPFFEISEDGDPATISKMVKRVLGVFNPEKLTQTEHGVSVADIPQDINDLNHMEDPDKLIEAVFEQAQADGKITSEEEKLLEKIKDNFSIYKETLKQALDDGTISKDEHSLLKSVRKSIFNSIQTMALEDGIESEDEKLILNNLKKHLGIN